MSPGILFEELWPLVKPYTLLHRYKARMLAELVDATKCLGADVAECGVFRGGMTLMMAKQLEETGNRVFAFDSFEGLPPERSLWETCYYQPGALKGSLVDFIQLLEDNCLENVTVRTGNFNSSLSTTHFPYNLRLIHIDCDVYSSTKCCIDNLYDKLLPGGIMVIDDYNDLGGGAEQAVAEHVRKTGELIYIGPIEQAFIVKGRLPDTDPADYVGWKPQKPDFFRYRVSSGNDLSVVSNDEAYIKDLQLGEALPDMPGKVLKSSKN